MVVHKRGGRQSVNGRRRQKKNPRRRSQSTSDENSTDSGETTRCVCDETHNLGLMVQCDKCEVWQHCECMGLDQPDIPDHYYCEHCKPENHKLGRLNNGRMKRHYVCSEKAPKKRMTLNSREASMSLEDVLAARTALELYQHQQKDKDDPPTLSDSPTSTTEMKKEEHEAIKTANKRKREIDINLPDTIDEKWEPPSSTVSSVGHEEIPYISKELEESSETPKPSASKPKRRQPKQQQSLEERKRHNSNHTKAVVRHSTGNRRGKPRSRTSTPVRECSPIVHSSEQEDDSPEHDLSILLFDYFSPQARASSPPAKARLPHTRMTLIEMNRRAKQILEYISSIQVEMAIKDDSIQSGASIPTLNDQAEDEDDHDSLSSASTIPLIHHEEEEEPVDKEMQSSMEIMDMLTRKLIKFQTRFGSRHRVLYEDVMMEEVEGRITRSREANGNINACHNMMAH